MGIAALKTGREWIRTTLATITIANGYAVEIKSTDIDLDQNPQEIPPAKLPRVAVFVEPGAGAAEVTMGIPHWTASETCIVDVFFSAPVRKEDGRDRHSRDACTTYLDAVWQALQTTYATAEASTTPPAFWIEPTGQTEYHYSEGPLTNVRTRVRVWTKWRPA